MLTWKALSTNMRHELKRHVVPVLRAHGFKGTFPNFVRVRSGIADLLRFQFSNWGAEYAVNMAACEMPDGCSLPRNIFSSGICCHRLTPSDDQTDYWLDFDKPGVVLEDLAVRCAMETASLVESRAEAYFASATRIPLPIK